MPHTPHTTTIVAKVIPTERLRQWRARHPVPALWSDGLPARNDLRSSSIAHQADWKIDSSVWVSIGGKPAIVWWQPTARQFHYRIWDVEYGRAGILDGGKNLMPISSPRQSWYRLDLSYAVVDLRPAVDHARESTFTHLDCATLAPLGRCSLTQNLANKIGLMEPRNELSPRTQGIDTAGILNMSLSRQLRLGSPFTRFNSLNDFAEALQIANTFGSDAHPNGIIAMVPLPRHFVPNAMFARKHELVPAGQPIPLVYLQGWYRETRDEQINTQCAKLLAQVLRRVDAMDYATERERMLAQDEAAQRVLIGFNCAASPGLFFDAYDDYNYGTSLASSRSSRENAFASPMSSAHTSFAVRSPTDRQSRLTDSSHHGRGGTSSGIDPVQLARLGRSRSTLPYIPPLGVSYDALARVGDQSPPAHQSYMHQIDTMQLQPLPPAVLSGGRERCFSGEQFEMHQSVQQSNLGKRSWQSYNSYGKSRAVQTIQSTWSGSRNSLTWLFNIIPSTNNMRADKCGGCGVLSVFSRLYQKDHAALDEGARRLPDMIASRTTADSFESVHQQHSIDMAWDIEQTPWLEFDMSELDTARNAIMQTEHPETFVQARLVPSLARRDPQRERALQSDFFDDSFDEMMENTEPVDEEKLRQPTRDERTFDPGMEIDMSHSEAGSQTHILSRNVSAVNPQEPASTFGGIHISQDGHRSHHIEASYQARLCQSHDSKESRAYGWSDEMGAAIHHDGVVVSTPHASYSYVDSVEHMIHAHNIAPSQDNIYKSITHPPRPDHHLSDGRPRAWGLDGAFDEAVASHNKSTTKRPLTGNDNNNDTTVKMSHMQQNKYLGTPMDLTAYDHLPPFTPSIPPPEPLRLYQPESLQVKAGAHRINNAFTGEHQNIARSIISDYASFQADDSSNGSIVSSPFANASFNAAEPDVRSPLSQIAARTQVKASQDIMGDFIALDDQSRILGTDQ